MYGHGAYLGPDFTAEYLHKSAEFLIKAYAGAPVGGLSARERVAAELHEQHLQPRQKIRLPGARPRAAAHKMMVEHYRSIFSAKQTRGGAQAEWITNPEEIRKLTAFFAWTAWTAAANRPGHSYSYTNNWPPEPLAGNFITADAITWSVISIIGLLGGTGLILYFFRPLRLAWLERSGNETGAISSRRSSGRYPGPASHSVVSFRIFIALRPANLDRRPHRALSRRTGGIFRHRFLSDSAF